MTLANTSFGCWNKRKRSCCEPAISRYVKYQLEAHYRIWNLHFKVHNRFENPCSRGLFLCRKLMIQYQPNPEEDALNDCAVLRFAGIKKTDSFKIEKCLSETVEDCDLWLNFFLLLLWSSVYLSDTIPLPFSRRIFSKKELKSSCKNQPKFCLPKALHSSVYKG